MASLLVVDDEPGITESLAKIFAREEVEVFTASSGEAALLELQKHPVDVVLTDLRMARLSGLDLLRTLRNEQPDTEVVLMTAYATVENAVEAMREGAYDFVTKPLRKQLVTRVVKRALEKRALVAENRRLKSALQSTPQDRLLGTSDAFRRVVEMADQVADTDATVLLTGESGTGERTVCATVARTVTAQPVAFGISELRSTA
jgi:two-component system response regulator HydG